MLYFFLYIHKFAIEYLPYIMTKNMRIPGTRESRLLDCKNAKIAEILYHGANYTREMIMEEVAKLQKRYPNKEF